MLFLLLKSANDCKNRGDNRPEITIEPVNDRGYKIVDRKGKNTLFRLAILWEKSLSINLSK